MSTSNNITTSSDTSTTQFAEDPRREAHEKETTLTLDGDGSHFSVTSFKKVVFAKLLQRPAFDVTRLHVVRANGQEHTVDCRDKVAASATVIGVTGRLPVGAVNIGTPRNSNSHTAIVK